MSINEIKEILQKRNYKKILRQFENEIFKIVPFAKTFEEALFCIKNELIEKPICQYPGCNNKIPHRCYTGLGFYPVGCGEDHTKKLNNLEKYGVENVSQLDTIKEKKESTCITKYGVKNPKQNKDIANKIKFTMEKKYGGFGKKGILKEKIENTCIDRFGTSNPMLSRHHRDKLVETLFNKIVERLSHYVIPNFTFEEYKGSEAKQEWKCIKCSTIFEGKIDNGAIPRCPTCYPNQKKSYGEMDLFKEIDELDKICSDWTVLNNRELDILIPSKNIAIEFNGIYWHSELKGKGKTYHLDKTLECEKKGIQLIHVFETEWYYQSEIVMSVINAKLKKFSKRIYARHCELREVNSKERNKFLIENHLQGQDKSTVSIGLFYAGDLVSIMTFGASRYNKKYQYEMHRFCNKIGHQVVGGASKLFTYFITKYNPISVITYADRRYSDGTFYEKIGFTKIGETKPNFFIINKDKLESRVNWQKHKLEEKLERYDSKLTAWENMQMNGFNRIWDCGNYKFEWIRKSP